MKSQANKINSFSKALTWLAIIIAANILGGLAFQRFDLTSEKRHTLNESTIGILEELEDVVTVRVYLEGDFPADFRRLRNAVQEKLDEMRAYAGQNLQYEFINPSENFVGEKVEASYQKLVDSGLQPTDITIKNADGVEKKVIFPGALITQNGRELPLQILQSRNRIPSPELLNNSINDLEYNIMSVIKRLSAKKRNIIALLDGQDEEVGIEVADLGASLNELYEISTLKLNNKLDALIGYDLLIVNKPQKAFTEKEKYILDQYIMKGGNVIWCIDATDASMDTIQNHGGMQSMALNRDLNLDDLLFTYGVRINKELILDRSCAPIPITVGMVGDQPNIQLFPWFYYPTLVPENTHPMVSNVDPIHTQFTSTIDTVQAAGIKKTVILKTSPYTRLSKTPARVNLGIIEKEPDFQRLSAGRKPVAVLLEGKFPSLFKNRLSPKFDLEKVNYKEAGIRNSKQLVIADGDVFLNYTNADRSVYYPLGYDKFLKRLVYGNKEFLLNAVNYMLNDADLINIRSRETKIRKLDPERLLANRSNIQIANLLLPAVISLLLGLTIAFLRKRKYTR